MEDAPTPKPEAAPAKAVIEATKVLEGRDLKKDEFEFTLTGAGVDQTKTNAVDGKVTFDEITYDKAGKYFYIITEKEGNEEGIIYDKSTCSVTVTVTENKEENKLEAAVSYGTSESATFTNKVVVPGSATAVIKGTKKLTVNGQPADDRLEAGEFEFVLKENDAIIDTTTNAADGSFSFADIVYTEAGTHTYTVAEVEGSENGVTYDKTVYTVVVSVTEITTDPAARAFEAEVIYPAGFETGVAFTNNKDEEKEIEISKMDATNERELPGAGLSVVDSEGNVVDSWTSGSEPHYVKLLPGTYTLKEDKEKVPAGYIWAQDITFTVTNDGIAQKVTMVDTVQKVKDFVGFDVTVSKKWVDHNEQPIAWPDGVGKIAFKLQYLVSDDVWADYMIGDNPFMVEVGDGEMGVFADLPAMIDGTLATYRAVEMTDVAGYTSVIVDGEGNKLSTEADFANSETAMEATNRKNPPGDFGISFTKKALGGTEIEGARIVLKDADGNVVDEWVSSMKAHLVMLPEGTYTMIETVAPEGYKQVTTEMTFTVDKDGKVTLVTTTVDNGGHIKVMDGNHVILEDAPVPENQKSQEPKTPIAKEEIPPTPENKVTKTVPATPSTTRRGVTTPSVKSGATMTKATSTGDSNNNALWIAMAAAAAAAMAGLGVMITRRRRHEDE